MIVSENNMERFIDTSAMLKLLLPENGSSNMKRYFKDFNNFSTISLCFAETISMLKVKYFYRDEITQKKYYQAIKLFQIYCHDKNVKIHEVDISPPAVFSKVVALMNKYKPTIDFIDSFQIYFLKDKLPLGRAQLITADGHLAAAAKSEKLKVWNCMEDPIP